MATSYWQSLEMLENSAKKGNARRSVP